MGQVKSVYADVVELLRDADYTIQRIAELLCVDVVLVQEIVSDISQSQYDGQPDEAQEWSDYDPDC